MGSVVEFFKSIINKLLGEESPKWVKYSTYSVLLALIICVSIAMGFYSVEKSGILPRSNIEKMNTNFARRYIVQNAKVIPVTDDTNTKIFNDGMILLAREVKTEDGGITYNFCWAPNKPIKDVLKQMTKNYSLIDIAYAEETTSSIICERGITREFTAELVKNLPGSLVKYKFLYTNGCEVVVAMDTATMSIYSAEKCVCK